MGSIIGLLGTLAALVFYLIKQRDAKRFDPIEQNRIRHEEIDKQVASGDGVASSISGAADLDSLDRLERLQNQAGNSPK